MKQLFFYLSILFLVSCRKSFDNSNQVNKIVLPSYTETGANTFGFMLNKKITVSLESFFKACSQLINMRKFFIIRFNGIVL